MRNCRKTHGLADQRRGVIMGRDRRFEGKSIIVTGAGMGIGRGAACAFADEGGSVIVADISQDAADETVREITSAGGRAVTARCDVSRSADVQAMIATGVRAFGGIDVVFNNAGINLYGTVEEMSEENWDRQIAVNLTSVFLVSKYAIPELRKRGGGAIVNNASVQAFASQRTVAAYAATKGGIVSMTNVMALDHARDGIRVNCIAPGSIHTPLLENSARTFAPEDPEGAIAEWGEGHPIGRVGTPEDVANLVLFLASDEASFCTGACYRVDGGLLSALM
jgi:NAD(P)-dependent dehydrogenase (short-subunit alcohol dehydrogenase family)